MSQTTISKLRAVLRSAAMCGTLTLLVARMASAQPAKPTYKRDVPAKLAAEAKVSEAAAVAAALARVPAGKVQSLELEREKGKLIYSMDLAVAGKSGIEEVNVDATNGSVVGVTHESPAAEKKEAQQEAAAKGTSKGTSKGMPAHKP